MRKIKDIMFNDRIIDIVNYGGLTIMLIGFFIVMILGLTSEVSSCIC